MVVKKTIKKSPIKKIENKPNIIFPEFEVVIRQKYDLNFLSIRKKIIFVGKKIGIIGFKLPKLNLWVKYCNWFNKTFNGE